MIPKELSTKNEGMRYTSCSNNPKTPNNDDLTDPVSPIMLKEDIEKDKSQRFSNMTKQEQIVGNDFSTQAVFSELKNP